MALRPPGLNASAILDHAAARVHRPFDPWLSTFVLVFGQLCIAVDERQRLVGIGVNSPAEEILVTICGRDEYGEWKSAQNQWQKTRRKRTRGRASA